MRRKKRKPTSALTGLAWQLSFYAGLKGYALEKGYKPNWAPYAFKRRVGFWPARADYEAVKPCAPDEETRKWIRKDSWSELDRADREKHAKARAEHMLDRNYDPKMGVLTSDQ